MRVTKTVLRNQVKNINDALKLKGETNVFELDWAYGGVRLCKALPSGGSSDVSPRVPMSVMSDILSTMYEAIYKMELTSNLSNKT